jgi:hypothetical protein
MSVFFEWISGRHTYESYSDAIGALKVFALTPSRHLGKRQDWPALLFKAKSDFFEWNAHGFCGPCLARADRHCERQRSRRNNFASTQWGVM